MIGIEGFDAAEAIHDAARGFTDHGLFAVDHFVVAQHQNEVFCEGVIHRVGELMVVPFAVDRIVTDIAQGVVHPTHIPFEQKAHTAVFRGHGDAGLRRGVFGNEISGGLMTNFVVELF